MPAAGVQPARQLPWSDERLLAECRRGNQQAWAMLLDKYKNLVYSIPVKMGLREEAADIFQSVFLDLLNDLEQIREPQALPKWLMQVSYHKCLRLRAQAERHIPTQDETLTSLGGQAESGPPALDAVLIQAQREQQVREAVRLLPPRCERLVRMLFYEAPARPYQEVARALGLATGSIGFVRGRCLARLRKELERLALK